MVRYLRVALMLLLSLIYLTPAIARGKSVKITEQTSFYIIDGRTASQFALSMSKQGPYSKQHRRRAWATASKDMSYQLTKRKNSQGCKVIGVKVNLKITYKLPKLRSLKGVTRRQRDKWKKMYVLLNRHERVHGRYYRQFARSIRKALLKLPAQPNCHLLDRKADRLVNQLNKEDQIKNRKFDKNDKKNYRRMMRIYSGS